MLSIAGKVDAAHLDHLARLLDDPSPLVQTALRAEIRRLGPAGLSWLEGLATDVAAPVGANAAEMLESIATAGAVTTFRRFIRGRGTDLETGLILLHRVVAPRLESEGVRQGLDLIADRVRQLLVPPTDPITRVRALNRVLFHELGFRGDADLAPDPAMLLIGDVLALRRGVPLALGLFYQLVAARLGVSFEPILLKEGFFLGNFRGREPFFVDPHNRGELFNWPDAQVVVPVQGLLTLHALWPASNLPVLRLLCARLRDVFAQRDEEERALLFAGFVEDFEATPAG